MNIGKPARVMVSQNIYADYYYLYFLVGNFTFLKIEIDRNKWEECQLMGIDVLGAEGPDSKNSYAVYQELLEFIKHKYGK